MGLGEALVVLSGLLGLSGTVLFCVGILEVRRPELVWLAIRMYGAGEQVSLGMRAQQVDFFFGLVLIGLAFILQTLGAFSSEENLVGVESFGCAAALILSSFTLFILVYLAIWYLVRKNRLNSLRREIEQQGKS